MKIPILALALQFISICALTQVNNPDLHLKTGTISFRQGIYKTSIDSFNATISNKFNKTILLLQFQMLPGSTIRKILIGRGIDLLDYLGQNVYMAVVSGRLTIENLQHTGIIAFHPWLSQFKMNPQLATGMIPAYARKVAGKIDLNIIIAKGFDPVEAESYLADQTFEIINKDWARFGHLTLRIADHQLQHLASAPFIQYIEPVSPDPEPLNNRSRQLTNATILNAPVAEGGKGLNGEGVTIGLGDVNDLQGHIDFAGRVISRTNFTDNHGMLVGGTLGSGGNAYELYKGFAPKSTVISETQSFVLARTPVYFMDHGMVVTNNSYGGSGGCQFNGTYDIDSKNIDETSLHNPEVLHVFAAGNSGDRNCPPYPAGFNTLAASWQSAKNVLTVGATDDTAGQADFTSRGPTTDGRIKPEITAFGIGVATTSLGVNDYSRASGTSLAAPAVSGGAALLYQRYRQLQQGNNPRNGLIKALLCNGADDKGVPGPDFTYGFGSMNLLRSVDMLDQNRYSIASLAHGTNNSFTINVPANTAQLKVMLYWNDPASLPARQHLLINDLDAEVMTPAGMIVLPLVPDTVPANVGNAASSRGDHMNNIEQIVIDRPAGGNYTIRVKGTNIPQGPQEYFLVYDVIPVSLRVTWPGGASGVWPGENINIRWDAHGNPGNGFTIEYSTDNGSNWTIITNNVSPVTRIWQWRAPDIPSANARIRITQNGTGLSEISERFTILGLPFVSLSTIQCEGSIVIQWETVNGATDYEVMMLRSDEMKSVGITTNTTWHFNSLSPDSIYWVVVRARINGRHGRRSMAISRQPDYGTCSSPIYDNDLKLDSILSPTTGRRFTSSALSPTQSVKVRIRNLDDSPANGFIIKYSLDGLTWSSETVKATIAPGGSYEHIFSQTADFSALGSYSITAVVKNIINDPITRNDTCRSAIRHLDNQPIIVNTTTPFVEDLESSVDTIYPADISGLEGLDRYDFQNETTTGELRTFVNTGVANSGRNSFVMGERVVRTITTPGLNVVTGTYNLAGKSVTTDDILLQFRYFVTIAGPGNDVWIRGSDTDPWIKVFDFNTNLNSIDDTQYKYSRVIGISDSLAKYGQQFSGSFQVRWRESGNLPKIPGVRMYSVDDISFTEVDHDLKMVSIDNPLPLNCGPDPSTRVVVSIHNSHNIALTNVPVQYRLNNWPWVTAIIPSIAANTRVQYQFAQGIDLSIPGPYILKAVVNYPGDAYSVNDTVTTKFYSTGLITSYTHLEDFESGNGGWYTEGTNSIWMYGAPNSDLIRQAASGTRVWKTGLYGHYRTDESSYLYSPCYELNGMTKPTLSFSMAVQILQTPDTYDYARIEYSVNGGAWTLLSQANGVINWYNQPGMWVGIDQLTWHVVTASLPVNLGTIRFRFRLQSDFAVTGEGLAIDDIHMYDGVKGIYDGGTMTAGVSKQVAGDQWIDFESNGKLVASIHPGGQDLGMTEVQAYINNSTVRYTGGHYYHDRNITIKPAVEPADSVTVRFYYLDSEVQNLLSASGCTGCVKPASAYVQGIYKYHNANRTVENGTMDDNNSQGSWSFIQPSAVRHVPFDKGYYAEFKVRSFSELWLNNGKLSNEALLGKVYPNPSSGKFNLVLQITAGQRVRARVINVSGQSIRNYEFIGTGFSQTYIVDLSAAASGMYLLQLDDSVKKESYKLIKE